MTVTHDWECSAVFLGAILDCWEDAMAEVFPDREAWFNYQLATKVGTAGKLRSYVARDGREMVGWAAYALNESWFQKGVTASCVSLYVKPAYRGTLGGILLRQSASWLVANGVDRVVCSASLAGCPETRFRSARLLFRRLGFTPSDESWELKKHG
jgi:GNAT superfamily N-acetyltransferase